MAHHDRVRADLAAWSVPSALAPDELEKFDAQGFASINGDAGGTYAPTDPIVIGGDGIHVTALANLELVTIDGSLTVIGGGVVDVGFFSVGANVNLKTGSVLTAESGSSIVTAAGSVLDVNGTCTMDGASTINGVMTFSSTCDPIIQNGCVFTFQSGSTLVVNTGSTLRVYGTLNTPSGSTITQEGLLHKSGVDARTRDRVSTLAANTIHSTISVNFDQYLYTQSDATGRTHTLLVTTAPVPAAGEVIHVRVRNSGGANVQFNNEGFNPICYASVSYTATFVFDATTGRWNLRASSDGVTMGADA